MAIDLILGTAGHIDHGKTSLVRALTGVDTDRLPEEKRRGITIDLGFAELELGEFRLGVVDVPGHERFVRNMLAGATGIDLALLVVAADDSVKPQTREHLDILRSLNLSAGVIALTKCDVADADWRALVSDEVRQLVQGTFLADAPLVSTSAKTGAGLDELRAALAVAAAHAAKHTTRTMAGPFRMAIDRTFTLAGFGTVVTGSVTSGECREGDELELQPGGRRVRVRGLQNHDRAVSVVARGQRAAINLAGVHHREVERGHELASLGHLAPSKVLSVRLELSARAPRPLKDRTRVRCHVGTAEWLASVRLLEGARLEPGATCLAQLFLSQPVAVSWRQALVIRGESPVVTLGGGIVLDPEATILRRPAAGTLDQLAALDADDAAARVSSVVALRGLRGWQLTDLARLAGLEPDAAQTTFDTLVGRGEVVELAVAGASSAWVHRTTLEGEFARVEQLLARIHERRPLESAMEVATLLSKLAFVGDERLLRAVLARMQAAGRLVTGPAGLSLAGRSTQLKPHEQAVYDEVLARFLAAGFSPPGLAEVRGQMAKNQALVPQLVKLAVAQAQLVAIGPDFYLHFQHAAQGKLLMVERLAQGGMTVSQIREALGTTRKFAVPWCEYLDRQGLTQRQGELRVLANRPAP